MSCSRCVLQAQSIYLREKQKQVRPRDQQCICIVKLAGQDLRFSMKMMLVPTMKLRYSSDERSVQLR